MRETVQEIKIEHYENGTFLVAHSHRDFTQETYVVKSSAGLIPVVRNLVNMKKPYLFDLYLEKNEQSKSSVEKALPID